MYQCSSQSAHLIASLAPGLAELIILGQKIVLKVCVAPFRLLLLDGGQVQA